MAGRHRHGRGPTVTVYTVSTREFTQLGSVKAAHITWSPDGSTLAYEGGEDGPGELRLVDADGDNDRLLVADRGAVIHGIGPVWSPIGDRIVYQRSCCSSSRPGRLDETTVVVGDLLALIIRNAPSGGRTQRVTLYQPSLWYGEQASNSGSCIELVESVPDNLDGGFFDDVDGDRDIETGCRQSPPSNYQCK